jgi:hypothetical protein
VGMIISGFCREVSCRLSCAISWVAQTCMQ